MECDIPTECQCNNASDCTCPDLSLYTTTVTTGTTTTTDTTSTTTTTSTLPSRILNSGYGHERKIFHANESLPRFCVCSKNKFYNSTTLACDAQKQINRTCGSDYECRLDQGLTCVEKSCKFVVCVFYLVFMNSEFKIFIFF